MEDNEKEAEERAFAEFWADDPDVEIVEDGGDENPEHGENTDEEKLQDDEAEGEEV